MTLANPGTFGSFKKSIRVTQKTRDEYFTRTTEPDVLYSESVFGKRSRMLQLLGDHERRVRFTDSGRARSVLHAFGADCGSLRAVTDGRFWHLLPRVQSTHQVREYDQSAGGGQKTFQRCGYYYDCFMNRAIHLIQTANLS